VATDEGGNEHHFEPREASNFSVMRIRSLEIRTVDSLLIQANSESADGRKLANGELVRVARFHKRGVIKLSARMQQEVPTHDRAFSV
jgi:hypothetical protein